MNELALFAGAGGGLLGSRLLGWHTVCAVEIDSYCRRVLFQRQRDGHLEKFPIWDDIRTFSGWPWRGSVDIVTGGFPCQDISSAGKGVGITGTRSGLVFEMLRVIAEVRPRFVLAENSPHLRTKGLGIILHELAEMGYDAKWGVLGAWHVGAPHRRDRLWIVAANSNSHCKYVGTFDAKMEVPSERARCGRCDREKTRKMELQRRTEAIGPSANLANSESAGRPGRGQPKQNLEKPHSNGPSVDGKPWPAEPGLGRVAYGVARRVDRLKAIGNGQVPRVVGLAFELLKGDL